MKKIISRILKKVSLKGDLSKTGRILFGVAALILLISFFLPWWHLNLIAPQYPEGLQMIIYPYKLEGRVDIINNINHYVGMKWISEDDFHEFRTFPIAGGVLISMALLTTVIKKRWFAWVTAGLASVGGLLGAFDLWYWLHKYGTEMDPMAAIKIPPFTPPIIGINHLANFTTYTGFNAGGYLLALGIIMLVIAAWGFGKNEEKEE